MAGQDLIGNELNDLEQRGGQAAYPHRGTDLVGGALGDLENRGGENYSQPHNETTGSPISEVGSQAQDAASQLSALGKGFTGGAAVDLIGAAKGGVGSVVVAGIKRHKKGVFGGVAGVVLSILLLALLSSLPFGFTSTMENIKAKEMKVLNENIASMNDNFMSYYIVKYVAPGMKAKQCTSTLVDRNCAVSAKGDGVVSRMFRAWQKASIENQWAKNGFEIRRDRATDRYYIRATGTGDIDITRYVANADDNMFHEINRADLRSVIRESHMRSSKWDRILVRFGWGKKTIRLAYGNVRCVLSCKVLTYKENYFSEPIAQKKKAFKIKFAQRVLYPRSQMIGLAFECLFAGSKCNPNEPDVREDGTYRTKFEAQLQSRIADLLATEGGEQTLKKAQAVAAALQEKGFQRVVIEAIVKSLLSKAGSSEAAAQAAAQTSATVAGTAVPVFFAINGFATVVTLLYAAGPTLTATSTMLQKASMVSTYSMNSAYSDEIKSSNVDATEVSSFSDSFSNDQQQQKDGTMGGCGAGGMPLYNAVVNEGDQTVTAFDGLGGAKAYAATPGSCKCPLTATTVNGLICPEQSLNYATYVTGAFGSVSNFLNKPGMKVISDAAKLWNSTIGEAITTITEPIVNLLQKAPGYSAIEGAITSAADSIFSDLASYIYPAWINDNMTGGDNFVATDGGARVVANDYAEKVMGGQPLTLQQQTAIETQADIIQEQTFKNKPLYARLFNKEDPHSLVTRLALAIPDDFHALGTNIFSKLVSDPFTKIIKGFGSIFAGHTAFATAPAVADPFSITHFGIPLDNPVYNQDPEGYFATTCDSNTHTEEWNKNVKINPALGIPEHTTSDPCLLINESASAGGGLYDSSLVGK